MVANPEHNMEGILLTKSQIDTLNNAFGCDFKEKLKKDLYFYTESNIETLSISDILDFLPKNIAVGEKKYYFRFVALSDEMWECDYFLINESSPTDNRLLHYEISLNKLEALFNLLLWCVNNKYIN